MGYSYKETKFKELIDEGHLTPTSIRNKIANGQYSTIQRWIAGEDIYIKKLVEVCNVFKLNLLDFFLKDGSPIQCNTPESIPNASTDTPTSVIVEYERRIADIRLKSQEELFKEKESNIKQLSNLEISLRNEFLVKIEKERERIKDLHQKELERIKLSFEDITAKKDETIFALKSSMIELQLQYKEMEMKLYAEEVRKPVAVAEEKSRPYTSEQK